MTRCALGVDVGGSAVKMALLRGPDEPVTLRGEPHGSGSRSALTDAARTQLKQLLEQANIKPGDIIASGIAVAGPIDDQGAVLQAVNLSWLEGTSVKQWLREVTESGLQPIALTDTVAAALAEHHLAPVSGRALYLSLGTGVGGAVLDDGRPVNITRGTPGHFGHMDVSGGAPDAPTLAACGRGGLEAYVGAAALRDATGADHPAMRQAVAALARAIRILLAIYRPEHIVLLGGLAGHYEPTLPNLREQIADGLTPAAPPRWDIRCGRSDPFAAAIGAARAAWHDHGPGAK